MENQKVDTKVNYTWLDCCVRSHQKPRQFPFGRNPSIQEKVVIGFGVLEPGKNTSYFCVNRAILSKKLVSSVAAR